MTLEIIDYFVAPSFHSERLVMAVKETDCIAMLAMTLSAETGSPSSNKCKYEIKDHLGNVRVVFERGNDGSPSILSHYDYYPYGMPMPGRLKNPTDYKFGFQGEFAEKDHETGYNDFTLRQYDSRLGRSCFVHHIDAQKNYI